LHTNCFKNRRKMIDGISRLNNWKRTSFQPDGREQGQKVNLKYSV
jgi:hypothetical protein